MSPLRRILPKVKDYPAFLNGCWADHTVKRSKSAPTVISTFAGCGGSSLGYSMAGFHELLAVEWDENAAAVFRLNFPGIPVYQGDIGKLSVEDVLKQTGLKPGELDVFDGSPPCQGFSTAGRRNFDDSRNQLFREYIRLLRGLKPKVFVMENVSGMIKGKMKLIFVEILRELKASGYKVSVRLLNAKYFGPATSRERMIFIGVREDLGIEPSHPAALTSLATFRQATHDLPEDKQIPAMDHVWIDEVARKTKWVSHAMTMKQGQKLKPGTPSGIRIYWDRPCPTICKSTPPGVPAYLRNSMVHPSQPRALSVREMARCQSFPDQFQFVDGLHNGIQRIGNSVPPLLMKAIASHIRQHILKK